MKKIKLLFIISFISVLCSCGGRSGGNRAGSQDGTDTGVSIAESARQVIALSDSLIAHRGADTVDMGRIRSGEIVSKALTLRNAGNTPLVIIDVDKSCGCLDVDYPRQPLRAGEEAPLELHFDSRGITGWVFKTLYVKTSSQEGNYVIVVTADVE